MKKSKKELYDDEAILKDFKYKRVLFVLGLSVTIIGLFVFFIIGLVTISVSDYSIVEFIPLICAILAVCILIYGLYGFNKAIKTQEELVRRAKRTDIVDEKMAQLETELAQLKRERSGESPSISDDDPPEDKDIGE